MQRKRTRTPFLRKTYTFPVNIQFLFPAYFSAVREVKHKRHLTLCKRNRLVWSVRTSVRSSLDTGGDSIYDVSYEITILIKEAALPAGWS